MTYTIMLLYRYRSSTELSFKELLYNELYFASQDELNDPFDGESFYHFPSDKELWMRLLNEVNNRIKEMFWGDSEINEYYIEILATALSIRTPITYGEIMAGRLISIFDNIVSELENHNAVSEDVAYFAKEVQRYLSYSSPKLGYFVSFSSKNNDHLMWGHYGAQHFGYSLIFRTIDGTLKQDPSNCINSVGITETYRISVPSSIPFSKVNYSENIDFHNACWLLPRELVNNLTCVDLNEIKNHWDKSDSFLCSKHRSWEYEQEYRLILNGGSLSSERLSPLQRLLHYDFSQLVGVVFGSKMSDSHKMRVKEIIKYKKESFLPQNGPRHVFPFVFFQARRSFNREIDVTPEEVFDCNFKIQLTTEDSKRCLKQWEDGYALRFDANGGCTPVIVI
ncbi:DUF2971 domain-containing protein [Shewanella sp. SG44-2]|uniref:DUF2971 domain-containing protein n=1 Tax=Shewanella sp. SG44-2 TaxID=2760962 RepID=UPI001601C22B|nr:DUF2971 domain-containing protein [Shewanella sp. SG44-2]MBB1425807.1 DUF2971 domain-containing protein [Shewanella sp. SG44-2]